MAATYTYVESTDRVTQMGTGGTFSNFVSADRGDITYRPEKISSPTCASDWVTTKGTGWSYDSVNKHYDCDGSQVANSDLTTTSILLAGRIYQVTFTITRTAGAVWIVLGTTAGTSRNSAGTYTEWIYCDGTSFIIRGDADFTGTVDDVYCKDCMGTSLMASTHTGADPKTYTLTYQVRPVEQKSLRILVYCIGTIDAGDTIDVNGVSGSWTTFSGAEAAGQTVLSVTDPSMFRAGDTVRLIDISAPANTETATVSTVEYSSGTVTVSVGTTNAYVAGDIIGINQTEQFAPPLAGFNWTTNRYGAIATVVATGMHNNDDEYVAVFQPIWGVIWDKGSGQYQLDSNVWIGDWSQITSFSDTNKQITIKEKAWGAETYEFMVGLLATLEFGTVISETDKTSSSGCSFIINNSSNYFTRLFLNSAGVIRLYSCSITSVGTELTTIYLGNQYSSSTNRIWNCNIKRNIATYALQYVDIQDSTLSSAYIALGGFISDMTFNKIRIYGCTIPIYIDAFVDVKMRDVVVSDTSGTYGIDCYGFNYTASMIDCTIDKWVILWLSGSTGNVSRQYSCNINICDKNGTAVQNAVVDCQDQNGNYVWTQGSVATDVSGNISEQIIPYRKYESDGGTGTTETTYSPHKFTISKTGYQTLVIDAVQVTSHIVWHLELQDPSTTSMTPAARFIGRQGVIQFPEIVPVPIPMIEGEGGQPVEKSPDEMTQKEYEAWRRSGGGRR